MPQRFFEYAFLVGLVVMEVVRAPHRVRNSRDRLQKRVTDSRVAGLEALLMTLSFFGLYLLPLVYVFSGWLEFADYALPSWTGWIGVVLWLGGLWIMVRAHRDLGEGWSPSLEVKKDQALVMSGIYCYVRHPIYASMWLFVVAQGLLLHNWIAGLAGLATYIPIYFTRVAYEEQLMLDHFGDEYRAYMKRTGRVLPRF